MVVYFSRNCEIPATSRILSSFSLNKSFRIVIALLMPCFGTTIPAVPISYAVVACLMSLVVTYIRLTLQFKMTFAVMQSENSM